MPPFVLKHYVHAESTNVDEQDLKVIVTTRGLLGLLCKSDLVQIDATYQLVWQGYPVMVCGTSDKNRVFHPFTVGVCEGESQDDFAFIFDALREFNKEWSPSILTADGSDSITAVFEKVFGKPFVRLMCYFHVVKNVESFFKVLGKTQ